MTSALSPWKPTRSRPFDRDAAARYLRRVAFAPSLGEIDAAVGLGPAALAERLVRDERESDRAAGIDALGERLALRSPAEIAPLAGWWLQRMVHSRRPFRERLLVFWHGHFATSHAKVASSRLMLGQLRTLERHAIGRFETLVGAIARDPAMLVWLDAASNVKGRPNENFARELLELFTLGVGTYGEEDVREAARAFTGWRTRDGRARFSPRYHDAGKKRVLGVSGELAGDDVVRIATGHPACARFLARKLLAEFVTPVPAERVVDELADRLAAGGELADVLEVLLASELAHDPRRAAFVYGPAAASPRVRSPVEWVVGTARALETRSPAGALERAAASLGQRLFEPPSVEGWEGHRAWLDSTSVWARIGLGISIAGAAGPDSNAVGDRDREAGIAMRAADLVATHELRCVDDVVRYGELVTLAGSAPSALQEQMRTAATGRSARLDEALRAVVRLGLASPESAVA